VATLSNCLAWGDDFVCQSKEDKAKLAVSRDDRGPEGTGGAGVRGAGKRLKEK